MEEKPQEVSLKQLFKNRQFLTLWVAQLVSNFGDWLAFMALFAVVAFHSNGSPYQVAGIMISYVVPWAFFGPVAGVFVDRWDVKRTMIASDVIRGVIVVMLAFTTELYQVYALVFALSVASSFFVPAQSVAIPLIVRKEELLLANSLNSQALQINKVIGPPIAALLVSVAGAKLCFYIDGFTFIFSAIMLSRIVINLRSEERKKEAQSVMKEFSEGVRFIAHHSAILLVIISIMASIIALGAFDALISIYVRDLLYMGERFFGILISMVAVGTLIGAAIISRYGRLYSKVSLVIAGILVMGVSVFVMAVFAKAAAVLVSAVVLGLGVAYVLIPSQTLIQEETPHEILGRVSSASMSLMTVSQLLAFLMAGAIAELIGIINLYTIVAAMLVLTAAFGFAYARANSIGRLKAKAATASMETPPVE